jgi:hypothetical protein
MTTDGHSNGRTYSCILEVAVSTFSHPAESAWHQSCHKALHHHLTVSNICVLGGRRPSVLPTPPEILMPCVDIVLQCSAMWVHRHTCTQVLSCAQSTLGGLRSIPGLGLDVEGGGLCCYYASYLACLILLISSFSIKNIIIKKKGRWPLCAVPPRMGFLVCLLGTSIRPALGAMMFPGQGAHDLSAATCLISSPTNVSEQFGLR